MMKDLRIEDGSPLANFNERIWRTIGILRGGLKADDLYISLYLLSLYKERIYPVIQIDQDNRVVDVSLPLEVPADSDVQQQEAYVTFKSIHPIFKPTLLRINRWTWDELNTTFKAYDNVIPQDHFPQIFEEQLYRIAKYQGRIAGESLLPVELSRFVSTLPNLPINSRVYNPFAGLTSFGVFLNDEYQYLGQEINPLTWALGLLRLLAHKKLGKSKLILGNSIEDWNPTKYNNVNKPIDYLIGNLQKEKFDLIISTPPFATRLSSISRSQSRNIRSYEQFFIENALNDLKEDGKLIGVVTHGFLSRSGPESDLRQHLVDNDLLEFVISFPGGLLMNTTMPIVVVVVNKAKKNKGFVHFIDAKKFVKQISPKEKRLNDFALKSAIETSLEPESLKIVSNSQIKDFDYNLSVARYFQKHYEGVELGTLGTAIRGLRITEGQLGRFVRIRDLKDDALNYQLNIESIEDVELPRHVQKIDESCLLLATRWRTLKPTYFHFSGTPIYISSDVLAFRVDERKCDVEYLINELHAVYVGEQVDALRTGEVIPYIRNQDLFSVVISFPPSLDENSSGQQSSLEEQRDIVKQKKAALAEEKKKEWALFNKIHGLEAEIVEQNTFLRHTLATPASNLVDSIANIKKILLDKIAIDHPELLDLKVSEKHLFTFGQYLDFLERDITKIVSAVSNQLKVETGIEAKKLTPVDIITFLEMYTAECNGRSNKNFTIEFDFDKEVFLDPQGERIKTFILGNEDLLRDLFNNLVDNAVKHAFSPEGSNRLEVYLMKNTENEEQDEVQILFSNTGKPFPENFTKADFIRKGAKRGVNAGEGFGGWYINEIIKRLDGDFDIIDETGPEGLPNTDLATSFEISFPIIEIEEDGQV